MKLLLNYLKITIYSIFSIKEVYKKLSVAEQTIEQILSSNSLFKGLSIEAILEAYSYAIKIGSY